MALYTANTLIYIITNTILLMKKSMNLIKELEQFLVSHQLTNHQLVLGLSGGVDSVVLLHLLHESSIPNDAIKAVHVNHGLSEQAVAWQDFCKGLCDSYNIHCVIEPVTLTERHLGIEGAARHARYKAFNKHLNERSVLLTAQHQDDQTETLLLALKRGSGVLGLAGMLPLTSLFNSQHARPLLGINQHKIKEYAQINQLAWVEDDSNNDTRFDRNFLRHDILNSLNERWPSFSANAAKTAMLCQQQMELADEVAMSDFENNYLSTYQKSDTFQGSGQKNDMLSVELLTSLSPARINNLLRYWMRINNVPLPSLKQLEQIKQQCIGVRSDKSPVINLGGVEIRCYAKYLYIVTTNLICDPLSMICDINKSKTVNLPSQLGHISFDSEEPSMVVKAPKVDQVVTIEFGLAGSVKAWPVTRSKRRTLKKLWQESNIPPWLRSQIPYLCYDGIIVAAIGYWIETEFCMNDDGDCSNESILKVEHHLN